MNPTTHPEQHSSFEDHVSAIVQQAIAQHPTLASRLERAAALVLGGAVWQQRDGSYYVNSGPGYILTAELGTCACPDAQHRSLICKHALSVGILRRAQREVSPDPEPDPDRPAPYLLTDKGAAVVTLRRPTPPPAYALTRRLALARWQASSNRQEWAARQEVAS